MRKSFILTFTIALFSMAACGHKSNATKTDDKAADTLSMKTEYIKADVYETNKGPLRITAVGHGSVMFEFAGKVIQIDPYSRIADYSKLPKADLLVITHEHQDHLDTTAINLIKKDGMSAIVPKAVYDVLGYGKVMNNGDETDWNGIHIEAVPAYNMVNKRPDGEAYHPKGRGNGYIFTFGDKQVYVAGDTENIPEMSKLKGTIYIAFLPKNLPYTMTDDMFIDAAKKVMPEVLYPYHMAEFDRDKIGKALEGTGIKLEVRSMKNN
jgi:L-ascorbate metabolism protein UlaG (beta-lactamase superfamily)